MKLTAARYSLRVLLVAVAIVAVGLAWWTRPHSVDWRLPDGTLAAKFRLRRDWRGDRIAAGLQSWYLPDGQCFRQQEISGARWESGAFVGTGVYADPVYPPHYPPDPPTAEYVGWLVRDRIPISTDLPSSAGEKFSYP